MYGKILLKNTIYYKFAFYVWWISDRDRNPKQTAFYIYSLAIFICLRKLNVSLNDVKVEVVVDNKLERVLQEEEVIMAAGVLLINSVGGL